MNMLQITVPDVSAWISQQASPYLDKIFINTLTGGFSQLMAWMVAVGGIAFLIVGLLAFLGGKTAGKIAGTLFILLGLFALIPVVIALIG